MSNIIRNGDVFKVIENWAPRHLAYDWDNVGLQVGSVSRPVKKVMVTLDVLETVVDEAMEKGVDLILAHHPLLFKAAKKINTDEAAGRMIEKLLKHDISVYAAHTNLDAANGGVNDMLCNAIGIRHSDLLMASKKYEKHGIGRIGELDQEMTLLNLSNHIKQALDVPVVRVTGDLKQKVKKLAVLGGSGSDFIHEAKAKGADVYLTGDMSFHHAQDAWQMGLSIIDPGHHVEKVMKQATKLYLENNFTTNQLEVITSETNTEPFQFV